MEQSFKTGAIASRFTNVSSKVSARSTFGCTVIECYYPSVFTVLRFSSRLGNNERRARDELWFMQIRDLLMEIRDGIKESNLLIRQIARFPENVQDPQTPRTSDSGL